MKLELSLTCPMNVSTFPFDSHMCLLKFSSFARWSFLKLSLLLWEPLSRKADEIEFVRMSGSEKPDALLDDRKLQDFSADASYIKVSVVIMVAKKGWCAPDSNHSDLRLYFAGKQDPTEVLVVLWWSGTWQPVFYRRNWDQVISHGIFRAKDQKLFLIRRSAKKQSRKMYLEWGVKEV